MQRRVDFILRWIIGTVAGWILGVLSWFVGELIWSLFTDIVFQYYGTSSWYKNWDMSLLFYVWLILSLLLAGALIGLGQWQLALKGRFSKLGWIAICSLSSITGTAGVLAGTQLAPPMADTYGGNLSGLDVGYRLLPSWPLAVFILGISLGLPIGITQWVVLQRRFHKAGQWIVANVIGSVGIFAAFVAIAFAIRSAYLSTWSTFCCVGPFVFSTLAGFTLYDLLQRPKNITTVS